MRFRSKITTNYTSDKLERVIVSPIIWSVLAFVSKDATEIGIDALRRRVGDNRERQERH